MINDQLPLPTTYMWYKIWSFRIWQHYKPKNSISMLLYFRKWFRIFHEKLWVGRIMKFLTIVHNTHLHLSLISFRQCDGSTFSCHCHELGHNRWKLHGKIFYSLLLIIRLLFIIMLTRLSPKISTHIFIF